MENKWKSFGIDIKFHLPKFQQNRRTCLQIPFQPHEIALIEFSVEQNDFWLRNSKIYYIYQFCYFLQKKTYKCVHPIEKSINKLARVGLNTATASYCRIDTFLPV